MLSTIPLKSSIEWEEKRKRTHSSSSKSLTLGTKFLKIHHHPFCILSAVLFMSQKYKKEKSQITLSSQQKRLSWRWTPFFTVWSQTSSKAKTSWKDFRRNFWTWTSMKSITIYISSSRYFCPFHISFSTSESRFL